MNRTPPRLMLEVEIIPCGDCFRWAYRFLMDHKGNPKVRLVHGMVHPDWHPRSYHHAWIELGKHVFDWQSHSEEGPGWRGKTLKHGIPIKRFYTMMNPEGVTKYTAIEAVLAVAKYNREFGRFHYGPWTPE